MSINGVKMITDRSPSDVEIAKSIIKKGFSKITDSEKEMFLAGLRGAYNYSDVNRVEGAIEYLANRLAQTPTDLKELAESLGVSWNDDFFGMPYDPEDYENVETKTDWSANDVFTEKERVDYINKIKHVLSALDLVPENFPQSLEKLNYAGANVIEKSLVDFDYSFMYLIFQKYTYITNASRAWFYSDDLYGGEI